MTTEGLSPALQQLIKEEVVRQLRKPKGLMATLGGEDGALKLDWVEGVQRLLADNAMLEQVEAEARGIWELGIRHIIWSGMGGSIMAVRVLIDLGFCSGRDRGHVSIYPCDSTDPAALNDIVRKIAQAKNLARLSGEEASNPAFLRALLNDVMIVGVSMGMTSEEPITHLEWFTELLQQAGLRPAEHLLVMTLPGSYLDRFAEAQQAPNLPLQVDGGTGTGGRMSAPTTRVFLLPASLFLTRLSEEPGQLRTVLYKAWDEYDLALATDHPFVQLAAALSDASLDGACRLLLSLPEGWQVLVPWIEQLMEEFQVTPYADFQEMLAREQLDVVDICTPSGLHGDHASQAMRSRRHVIVEKPMEISRAAIAEMLRVQPILPQIREREMTAVLSMEGPALSRHWVGRSRVSTATRC